MEKDVSRRYFLKTSSAGLAGLALSYYGCATAPPYKGIITYEDAVAEETIRQKRLDQTLERKKRTFKNIEKFTYHEDPMLLRNDHRTGIDKERMERTYTLVFKNSYDFGKGKKSEVHVLPKLFDELLEEESNFCLKQGNNYCMDIRNGIEIGGHAVDAEILAPETLDELLELRGYYSNREKMLVMATFERTHFVENVRPWFVNEMCGQHRKYYTMLKTKLEEGRLSDYDADVVREHLLELDRWIEPEYLYKE